MNHWKSRSKKTPLARYATIKYLGINLTKEVKDHCTEKNKTLEKQV